ncbi:MAG: protein kinase [Myxococcales bacterium]|nr:protein kinase [Myxococcales bacterium]MCB9712767.1 protein kinase [Myxococcales bacterium]
MSATLDKPTGDGRSTDDAATVMVSPRAPGGATAQAPEQVEPGDPRSIGRFTVLHKIAEGGMGIVYAALDEQLERKVAIKLLHARGDQADQAHERMIREARAMARLSHPNVVQVHEVGELDGRIFVAMEYVQGLTLRRWLKAAPRSWRDVLEIFRQAGQGLAAAHRAGIVHRDFKPDNVVVGKDRRVKVLDFGLARWNEPDGEVVGEESAHDRSNPPPELDDERSLTKTGFVMGTPAYMSPEQHEGFPADARSDQFGFCVALYEALYGRRPFPGRSYVKVARAITEDDPLPPPADANVPKWLHKVVMRGLSRDAADRFPSMDALISGFEDFQAKVDARNTEMLRLETGLGTLLMLAFWILDWLFVPEHIVLALLIRLGICTYAGGIHFLCRMRPRLAERHVDLLAFSVNLAAGWGLAAIVWLEGGLESAYYAGLNLLVLCIGIMFLWTIRRALLLNGLIYGFYMSPLLLGLMDAERPDVILSNQFFLLSTIIITVAAQHQRFALQRREFLAEQERTQLREEVAAMVRGGRRPELHDRAQFLLLAEDEFQRSRRYQRPMSCLVLGVDEFAEINAQHGDSVGDEILAYLRQRIVKDIRQFDLVGKYHGDEFVFLLPETEQAQAEQVADRLIDQLGFTPVSTKAGIVEITLSVGLSMLSRETPDLATLLLRAVSSLEQAKHEGGARTVAWSGEHMISTKQALASELARDDRGR